MLETLKEVFSPEELLKGNYGIEREGLRVNKSGELSNKKHPIVFGNKLNNPYITTDFSESQLELITPVFETTKEVYQFLSTLYDVTALEIEDEYIWPQSMPSIAPVDDEIPLAQFCNDEKGSEANEYREKLLQKYGGKKQLISGIHYNFSFSEEMLDVLYKNSNQKLTYINFKNQIYLKMSRNYLRYNWLLIYLLGGSGAVHETYLQTCDEDLDKIGNEGFSNGQAMSYRNSVCGYTNRQHLFPNYDDVEKYVESINEFIKKDYIENIRELYSPIRLKTKMTSNPLSSLVNEGINYLEYRSIDINPFSRAGISLGDLEFMNLFNLFLLLAEENEYGKWQIEALENQEKIAKNGQEKIQLKKDGVMIDKEEWGMEILNKMASINQTLNLGKDDVLKQMVIRMKDYTQTYTSRIVEKVRTEGYVTAHLNLAKEYREEAYQNRFKLEGFEDLELSTQILMKEAIKKGIKVQVIDRSENLISLRKDNKIEYVKQATKTSKDNYVSVLMMENKVITKNILADNQIDVPKGEEFHSLDEGMLAIKKYVNQPIVIKPKSTNFGIGISIFPKGATKKDIIKALQIAFKHDTTVLLEEFVTGKEYRFMVINNEVSGILHRVPANVTGHSERSIRELVEEKNKNPLRGKGYKTPLEKIDLDENVALFLKQQGLNFDSIPSEGEIIYLRENSNISTGGDSVDYTDSIPDYFKKIAVESAKAIGANICGVDMMIDDFSDENSKYAIIELNFNPAIHIHSYPFIGTERNIAKDILSLLEFKEDFVC